MLWPYTRVAWARNTWIRSAMTMAGTIVPAASRSAAPSHPPMPERAFGAPGIGAPG